MSDFTLSDGTWRGVTISASEAEVLARFIAQHAVCCADISISVSASSGIGQNVVVDCGKHRKVSQTDITNYAEW